MTDAALQLVYHHVDAFADRVFGGNPAIVIVHGQPLETELMQAIAAEHNLSETAFVYRGDPVHELRWFTPTCEVELCGHATLASAHVLLEQGDRPPLRFITRKAGELMVDRDESGQLWLDFPSRPAAAVDRPPPGFVEALGVEPVAWAVANNHLAVFDDPATVAALAPDRRALTALGRADDRGLIVTAPAAADSGHDFVSRYFAPAHGVDEDPVTGSAHCTLGPYWSARLQRDTLIGRQLSQRGGTVRVHMAGDRAHLGGRAVTYARGELVIAEASGAPR